MKRRDFLIKMTGGVAGGLVGGVTANLMGQTSTEQAAQTTSFPLPRRALGKTGEMLSVVGFPGYALAHATQAESIAGMRRAFERGVNYFDVAPAYGKDGECEIKMGPGLLELPRSEIFLSCKTMQRDRAGAQEELDRSLKRLKTDHIDLYQCHCFSRPDEVKRMTDSGGALETLLQAKAQGKVRYLGFSAHTTVSALAAMQAYPFDTVMFPINFVEDHAFGFGREVLDLAARQGTSVIAIKPISAGAWARGETRTRQWWYRTLENAGDINLALRFTLAQKQVVTAIPSSFLDLLDKTLDAAHDLSALTDQDRATLAAMAGKSTSLFETQQRRALAGDFLKDPNYARAYAWQVLS